ncbi:E3 ubiquitin-protein ligase ZFP91 isoform X1 [Falco biarmicus]|uniref:E3 ubiquitin-protein ligase ZFP91 isoform X1 n=1 Tax=Falco rusticolus TaxID=120794 RepID=UPI00188687AF|nr:E3 ubiquitin-protein ligase ZFP91 isoform X1 [Falco rusticolus]XP_040463903.1 E3 ubiquitin-protein ligase ZFP91 isoform X1 [Falco naumanni]XP_055670519.1 E3 ubiquitin-protein ligase ZFP91 isoform X1 [Falco peregrinus]XP_056210728.1 E3 ubiquitin-protein ligase ZFP91 isoform X1 [Falco biarmicus]
MPAGTEQPGGAEEQPRAQGPPAAAERPLSTGRRRPPPPAADQGEESGGSRVLRGGRERGRAAAAAASAEGGAAVASRRRKAEYPRRRRSSPGARPAAEQPPAETPPAAKKAPRVGCTDKTAGKDPKEEKEEKEISSILTQSPPVSTARPSRSWRSSRSATVARQRDAENSRASRSKTGSLQLVCKSEPNADHLEYEVTEEHQSPAGISSDDDEMLISEEEVPFKDDPRDETYKPHLEKEAPKQRRKASKGKEEKEKQKEIKVEVKEESEFREDEEPPRKRGRRRKDDKSPRLPKRRKKPPIQYVRCEMEGCGTVLAHPRYLQHHIKYQHLLKKKYVCPHPSCGRLFRLQKQLLRHAKHHTDQRDYICEYCARAFKSSHNLAVHRMIHTGEKPLQCEICGFTCRQKASLNWHMKKHDADSFYQFSCNICGKKFEKKDSVVAHKAKSHPEVLIAEALAANAGALITSTDILGTNPEAIAPPTDGQGLPLLPDPLGSAAPADCLLLNPDGMPKAYCGGAERVSLVADGKLFVGSGSSANPEGLVMNTEILGATTEVLIEDSDSTGP